MLGEKRGNSLFDEMREPLEAPAFGSPSAVKKSGEIQGSLIIRGAATRENLNFLETCLNCGMTVQVLGHEQNIERDGTYHVQE